MGLLYHILLSYGIIGDGRVAEWLMALVLKTSRLTSRRFESCPFRHRSAKNGVFLLLVDVEVGGVGGVDTEISESNHFVVRKHVGGVEFGVGEFGEGLEGFLGDWISSGANGEGD